MTTPRLSIIVCTYNRDWILDDCLHSLTTQTASTQDYEVLVINNQSTDNTQAIIDRYCKNHEHFRSIIEEKQGLSHARNRGYQESQANWVGYVDDDAKAHNNLVERALWLMENKDFDGFGGIFNPWYRDTKPKWVEENFQTNRGVYTTLSEIKHPTCVPGGLMFFKKHILEELSGFATNLGMSGGNTGYGEDTQIQKVMSEKGYRIAGDPALQIDHLVAPYKLSVIWHIKVAYAGERDKRRETGEKRTMATTVTMLSKILIHSLFSPIKNAHKMLRKDYYWQNWACDSFCHVARKLGKLHGLSK